MGKTKASIGSTAVQVRRHRLGLLVVLAGLWLLGLPPAAASDFKNDSIGFSSDHFTLRQIDSLVKNDSGTIQGEDVDIMTGNVTLSIPIGPRYALNKWFGYQVILYYNSKVWRHEYVGEPGFPGTCPGQLIGSDTYGVGFHIYFGRIYRHPDDKPGVYRYQNPSGA